VKIVVTALIVVAVLYGIYQFTVAAYGWFQMSSIVDEVASRELRLIAERGGQQRSLYEGDRYAKLREGILKGAEEAGVDLRPEDVALTVADNTLDVRLTRTAPMVRYQGPDVSPDPMTVQRGFSLLSLRPGLRRSASTLRLSEM
jgi:hypothetical protein